MIDQALVCHDCRKAWIEEPKYRTDRGKRGTLFLMRCPNCGAGHKWLVAAGVPSLLCVTPQPPYVDVE
jgi:hypothetical protein